MTAAAARRGYRLEGASRKVTADELESWSMIVAMDRENLTDLQALAGGEKASLRLFSEFLPPGSPVDVPDPYYGGPGGFDHVYRLLSDAMEHWMQRL